jgi:hypothetical protein
MEKYVLLVLNPSTLIGGCTSYASSLITTVSTEFEGVLSSSICVKINLPQIAGRFMISPFKGKAWEDEFIFYSDG